MRRIVLVSIALIFSLSDASRAANNNTPTHKIKKIAFSDGRFKLGVDQYYILPGHKVLFSYYFRLYIADYENPVKSTLLANQKILDMRPSPVGRNVAYIQTPDDVSMKIFIIGIDGSAKKLLWSYKLPSRHDLRIKEWSQNGKEIIVVETENNTSLPDQKDEYVDKVVCFHKISVNGGTVKRENMAKETKSQFFIKNKTLKVDNKELGIIEQPFFDVYYHRRMIFSSPGVHMFWEGDFGWSPQVFDLSGGEVMINAFSPENSKKPPFYYQTTAPNQRDGRFKLVLLNLSDLSGKQIIYDNSNPLVHFTRSPDKKYLAYTDPNNNIIVAGRSGKTRSKVAFESEMKPETVQWAPDNKSFFIISDKYELYHVIFRNDEAL